MSARAFAWLLALALLACGTKYVDPIQRLPAASADACGEWLTESDCLADAAHGCSFQPNALGCKTDDPKCAAGSCRAGDPFVRSRPDQGLWLLDQPYRFVGTVSWGIAWGQQLPGEHDAGSSDGARANLRRSRRLEADGAEGLGIPELRGQLGQRLCELRAGHRSSSARRRAADFRAREPIRTGLHVRPTPQRLLVRFRLRVALRRLRAFAGWTMLAASRVIFETSRRF